MKGDSVELVPATVTIRRINGAAYGVIDHRTGVEWVEWSMSAALDRQEWLIFS